MGLPSTSLDEGIGKLQPLPESKTTDPKDPGGNIQPASKGLPSMASDKGMVKTTSLPERPRRDKDSEGLKPPVDMEPPTNPVADYSGTGAKYQVDETQSIILRCRSLTENKGNTSSEVEPDSETLKLKTFVDVPDLLLFDDEMVQENSDSSSPELKKYDNILPLTKRQLVKYLRKVSRVSLNRLTEDQWEKHEEAVVSYADLGAYIEGYYKENIDHMDQTDKLVQATMNSLDKNSTERDDLLKALNGKVLEATKAYTANSHNITELLSLAKTFDFSGLKSLVETMKAALDAQTDHLATWAKSSTSMA
ncbi:hypothetical protein Tco_0838128 [Tanacetum coccineum]|uniref:Uncharacterized protein n=1 Tax=Tanacetum coccineum TaxID=301880 RepID=A0ABQ5ALX3_9ASTR